jgi:hypothetical protein
LKTLLIDKVKAAIAKLRNNKPPSKDTVTAELIKYGSQILLRKIPKLILLIWQQEKMSDKWNEGLLCTIFKKGDKLPCSNYRGITLLNVT